MKTLEEVKNDIAHEYGSKDYRKDFEYGMGLNKFMDEWEFMDKVAKRYATEAIKSDRERVAEEVYMKHNGSHQCKQLILNLPIELK